MSYIERLKEEILDYLYVDEHADATLDDLAALPVAQEASSPMIVVAQALFDLRWRDRKITKSLSQFERSNAI